MRIGQNVETPVWAVQLSLLCGAAGFSRLVYSIFDNRLQEQHVMARRMCVAALLSYMTAMGFTLFGLLSA